MIVNAAATLTRLGGSLMHPSVVAAMAGAAQEYVDLPARAREVGARLADLTRNADAVVTAGAAAGITLAVASAVTGPEPAALQVFPDIPDHLPNRVVVPAPQRNGYDYAVTITGATIVGCGPDPGSLAAALNDRTACVLWFAGTQHPCPGLSLEQVVDVAHERGVPVVVDAAAQVPPVSSLWSFTLERGADLAIFSGGKGLRGPQTTGLAVGRADLVAGMRAHGSPHHGIGRGSKVGKEELAGLLTAVELALSVDEQDLLAGYERIVAEWISRLAPLTRGPSPALASVRRTFPSEAGQPHGRVEVTTVPSGPTADELEARLWGQEPQVAVLVTGPRSVSLNPQPLAPGHEDLVSAAVVRALQPDG